MSRREYGQHLSPDDRALTERWQKLRSVYEDAYVDALLQWTARYPDGVAVDFGGYPTESRESCCHRWACAAVKRAEEQFEKRAAEQTARVSSFTAPSIHVRVYFSSVQGDVDD